MDGTAKALPDVDLLLYTFFAEAIRYSAHAAIQAGQRVTAVFAEDRAALKSMPRIAGNLLLVQEALMAKPMATIAATYESHRAHNTDGDVGAA